MPRPDGTTIARVLNTLGKAFVSYVSSRPILSVLMVLTPWLMVTAFAQSATDKSDPQALVRLERAWNDAFYRKDIPSIDQILADEFVGTYEDGSQGDKAKELTLTREFNQQVDSTRQDQFVVKIFGETAVVWFTLHLTGPRQGQTIQVDLRYVDVFIWRNDRWQCVSSHSTKVAGV